MGFLEGFFLIGSIHLLAAMSPGPDFVLVAKESLSHGRKAGILSSFGITLGLSVHIVYSSLGLAAIVANSMTLLVVIKILGGSYLIYLGVSSILNAKKNQSFTIKASTCKQKSYYSLIKTGFLCNVFNPKAPLYFVALFTMVLSPNLPLSWLIVYGIWLMIIQFVWFGFVVFLLTTQVIQKRFYKFGKWINYLLGGTMIALGIKIFTSKA